MLVIILYRIWGLSVCLIAHLSSECFLFEGRVLRMMLLKSDCYCQELWLEWESTDCLNWGTLRSKSLMIIFFWAIEVPFDDHFGAEDQKKPFWSEEHRQSKTLNIILLLFCSGVWGFGTYLTKPFLRCSFPIIICFVVTYLLFWILAPNPYDCS